MSVVNICFHLLMSYNEPMLMIFGLSFDSGEDNVSGVLLHHKQVIKPYYLFVTVGLIFF